MNRSALIPQPKVERQPAKDIKATASPGDEDVLGFVQFVEEWDFHSTNTPFLSAMPITARVPELNSRKSCSMPSLKMTPCSPIWDSMMSGCCAVTRPNTSDAP